MTPLAPEVLDLLRLRLIPGIGPRLTAALLERFGSAGRALRATPDQLRQVAHIGPKLASQIVAAVADLDVDAELQCMAELQVHLLVRDTSNYPTSLATIPDPPYLLYCRGNLEARDADGVALVGSRNYSPYGRRVAERLAAGLARAGITVISGLARGIDGVAHRAALQAGGRTVAVLAGGLSRIYPPEHKDLAEEVQARGALLTEASMQMEPMAGMFPARNRIISGLARAVVVVEAGERSGALITATHAGEQGRPLLAVPGAVDSEASAGTNALIRTGAVLCRSVDDILEELHATPPLVADASRAPTVPEARQPLPDLEETPRQVWDQLAEQAQHVDDLSRGLGLPVAEVSGVLMLLELKRLVRRLPGNRYERC